MASLSSDFRARLAKIPASATQAARGAMEQGAEEMVQMMRRLAPVDDGELRASINWTWGDAPPGTFAVTQIKGGKRAGQDVAALRVTIYANAKDAKGRPYASWVEFGTKRQTLQGEKQIGANPYFYPSYRALRKRVMGRIIRAIRKAIKEA